MNIHKREKSIFLNDFLQNLDLLKNETKRERQFKKIETCK